MTREEREAELESIDSILELVEIYCDVRRKKTGEIADAPAGAMEPQIIALILKLEFPDET